MQSAIMIGTAGWTIPTPLAAMFSGQGTHLERYARRFSAVEINSSFYQPHKSSTYARWAGCVPPDFQFAVKLPREITHVRKLVAATEPLDRFLTEIGALGDKLGPVLMQLPPSFRYEEALALAFLEAFRARFNGSIVCEPRNPTWFTDAVDDMLSHLQVARVAADPAVVPRAAKPSGWSGIVYQRLHGSPRMYHSAYPTMALDAVARTMRETPAYTQQNWCIFDNTADGEATKDALSLLGRLS